MFISTDVMQFSGSAEEELALLIQELRLKRLVESLAPGSPIPDDLKADLRQMVVTLHDLFGSTLPAQEDDPLEALRLASRDIHLSKVLRERGLFRVYRALSMKAYLVDEITKEHISVPGYMALYNPDSGQRFLSKEEFIGWFCREAKVARSLVFQRIATISKLHDLGFSLEESYQVILAKPFAVQETLREVADWNQGQLVQLRDGVAQRLAAKMLPEQAGRVENLQKIAGDPGIKEEIRAEAEHELTQIMRPAIAGLVREVAEHPSVRDAMDFVRHDIAARPEIGYRWDNERDELIIELVRKSLDPHGVEYISDVLTIRMIPDPAMPSEVRRDLTTRLPVKNREVLDI